MDDPALYRLLQKLHDTGGITRVDGDRWPVPQHVLDQAVEQKFVHFSDGGSWGATETVRISRKGMIAIGIEVPPIIGERLLSRILSIFTGKPHVITRLKTPG